MSARGSEQSELRAFCFALNALKGKRAMSMDKVTREINRKLDLIIENLGIKDEGAQPTERTRTPRTLTDAEQQAIDNAPKAEASVPPTAQGPRTTAQNAPDTSSSVPKDAVGSVTVETQQPDGKTTTQTVAADKAKGKK